MSLRESSEFECSFKIFGYADIFCFIRIIQVVCRKLRLSPEFNFTFLARNTPGYVGADLAALAQEASVFAVQR